MPSLSRLLLFALLTLAGLTHLIAPGHFDPAIPFPWKLEINILVGVLEILLAVGLWLKRYQDFAARMTALWFLLLIPVHIYVSWFQVPIFGVSDRWWLWGRTLLQPALYFWALSLQKNSWLMAQSWHDVVFLHYTVDPKVLQEKVPFPLDLYQGKAVVSIVPFVMKDIRFPFLPAIPGLSQLLELNLRTYVKVAGRPAVYFFTLDSNHLPGVLIARWFFALPYRWVKLRFSSHTSYEFSSPDFHLSARPGTARESSAFDLWATERYALYTQRSQQTLLGIVEHAPWSLQDIEVLELCDEFSQLLGEKLKMKELIGASYCPRLNVRFKPFRRF